MISYEASKWYVKIWRNRWYIYAIYLHIKSILKNILKIEIVADYLLDNSLDSEIKENILSDWKMIIRHVEVSKMYKFSK